MHSDLPLGRDVDYPDTYSPGLLVAVSRQAARQHIASATELPFSGEDIWNAWELTWLDAQGKPAIAAVELRVPAESTHICESKSLKLYLNSFAMSRFPSPDTVRETIADDLSAVVDGTVRVRFMDAGQADGIVIAESPGTCIDTLDIDVDYDSAPTVETDASAVVSETLYSDLFRSLCPVTAQPDFASVSVSYRGPQIQRDSLLRYLLSFRRHQDFHEACVEQIFMHLASQSDNERLLVSARFLRRGGIDINPWRANYDVSVSNDRGWRQ
ncbi:MAG: NADPH-dependent 7-cyano-7-deazaguanine reductase QueF [Pseudomonadota bacterium]